MATRTPPRTARPLPFTPDPTERPARSLLASTVGTKILIALTGLLLIVYLITHAAGNSLVYFGPAVFNGYGHFMIHNPLIVPIELGLLAIFLLHVYKGVTNWIANRRARPVGYYQSWRRAFGRGWGGPGSRKSIASSTMLYTGVLIAVFLVVHLVQFKYGPEYLMEQGAPNVWPGGEVRDLYRLEVEVFGNLLNVLLYVVAMVVVGFHLWHGFASAFQSLGADHPRTTPWVLRAGKVFSVLMAGGFITIPIWVYFFGGRP